MLISQSYAYLVYAITVSFNEKLYVVLIGGDVIEEYFGKYSQE